MAGDFCLIFSQICSSVIELEWFFPVFTFFLGFTKFHSVIGVSICSLPSFLSNILGSLAFRTFVSSYPFVQKRCSRFSLLPAGKGDAAGRPALPVDGQTLPDVPRRRGLVRLGVAPGPGRTVLPISAVQLAPQSPFLYARLSGRPRQRRSLLSVTVRFIVFHHFPII